MIASAHGPRAPRTARQWTAAARSLLETHLASQSPRTAAGYAADLAMFARHLGLAATADGAAEALGRLLAAGRGPAWEMAAAWKAAMRTTSHYAPATVNRRLSALRSAVRAAGDAGLVGWALRVRLLPARPYRDTRGPGRSGVRAMLDACRAEGGPKGIRDLALVLLMYGLGLRRAEVAELDVRDLDLRTRRLWVTGKGHTDAEPLVLPPRVEEALAEWVTMRGPENGPLFANFSRAHRTGGISGRGLYQIIREIGRAAGVRCTPHGLRHAAITDAIAQRRNPAEVQRFSRHTDLRTLQLYYDAAADLAGEIAEDLTAEL